MQSIHVRAKTSMGKRGTSPNIMSIRKTSRGLALTCKKQELVLINHQYNTPSFAVRALPQQSLKKRSSPKTTFMRTAASTPVVRQQRSKIVAVGKPLMACMNMQGRKVAFENFMHQLVMQAESAVPIQTIKNSRSAGHFPNNFMSSRKKWARHEDIGTSEALSRILYKRIYREPFHISRTRSVTFFPQRSQKPYLANPPTADNDLVDLMETRKMKFAIHHCKSAGGGYSRRSISTAPTLFKNPVLNQNIDHKATLLDTNMPEFNRTPGGSPGFRDESEESPLRTKLLPRYTFN